MKTLTKSILVIVFFAALTIGMLFISGIITGNMDHRWNMAIGGLRETTWIIKPIIVMMGIGLFLAWIVYRSKKLR